ncbi:hypothetical protein [Streptomyces sp. HUAS TT7]|uniref:hypothetical protein n=1 Tax=Streptomyces sp. HUAS TT7 TaxID=3447507 RepID=UPI003F65DDF8
MGFGLPARAVTLGEVRALLLQRPSLGLCDAIWRELALRARRGPEAQTWMLAALGVMLPGLRKLSRRFGGFRVRDQEELDAELVARFLSDLSEADLTRERLPYRLWWSAKRCAWSVVTQQAVAAHELEESPVERPIPSAVAISHPDLALARMRRGGVITTAEEELIARTRLEGESLAKAAQRLGISYQACKQRRGRAERRVVRCLGCAPPLGVGVASATGALQAASPEGLDGFGAIDAAA